LGRYLSSLWEAQIEAEETRTKKEKELSVLSPELAQNSKIKLMLYNY